MQKDMYYSTQPPYIRHFGSNMTIKGGGMVGYTFEKSILRYGMGVMAWGHTDNLQVVLDPCAQCCPCEASVQ